MLAFTDASDGDAKAQQLSRSRAWLSQDFGLLSSDAAWNKPKTHRLDTPTAKEGRSNGKKRKADLEGDLSMAVKHHVRALTYF